MIIDAVSNLVQAIQASLRLGILKKRSQTLDFPIYIFNYLFKNKGTARHKKPGRLYSRDDFDLNFFKSDDFVFYNENGEACKVEFPLYMNSYIRWCPKSYDKHHNPLPRDYRESLKIYIAKSRNSSN